MGALEQLAAAADARLAQGDTVGWITVSAIFGRFTSASIAASGDGRP